MTKEKIIVWYVKSMRARTLFLFFIAVSLVFTRQENGGAIF